MDELEQHRKKLDQLYKQFSASPIVELSGIVCPSGVAGGKTGGEELWSLILSFEAWRIENGPLRNEPLTIRKRLNDAELKNIQSIIDADTVIRIRARILEKSVFDGAQAQLEEYIGLNSSDTELQKQLIELTKPITLDDEQFGVFTFDRSLSWYTATANWAGHDIDLTLSAEDQVEAQPCLKVARTLWANMTEWKNRIDDYAVQELLDLKNDTWLGDDESEFSPQMFKNKMTIQSITIYPDGDFEFWHDDGDLFWGHSIQVSGNLTDGPTDADIPG